MQRMTPGLVVVPRIPSSTSRGSSTTQITDHVDSPRSSEYANVKMSRVTLSPSKRSSTAGNCSRQTLERSFFVVGPA